MKIVARNINNLRYEDDSTLMAESEEISKSFMMNIKEENEKRWVKTQPSKIMKIMLSGPNTSWQIDGENVGTVSAFFFFFFFFFFLRSLCLCLQRSLFFLLQRQQSYQMLSHSVVSDSFMTLRTVAFQALLSLESSRQKYQNGLPFPSLGDLPDQQIEPTSTVSPTLLVDSLPTEPSIGEALCQTRVHFMPA